MGCTVAGLVLSLASLFVLIVFMLLGGAWTVLAGMSNGNGADPTPGLRALFVTMMWITVPITTIALICSIVGVAHEDARLAAVSGIVMSMLAVVFLISGSPILY